MKAWTWEELKEISKNAKKTAEFEHTYGIRGVLALAISNPGFKGYYCPEEIRGDDACSQCPADKKNYCRTDEPGGLRNVIEAYQKLIKKHGRYPRREI